MRTIITRVRRGIEPLMRRTFHTYWRFSRGLTLGVRGVVIDPEGRIFLVQHSYVSGWHLPGGGVEVGETAVEALARELHEEGNIRLAAEPELHGFFFNRHVSRRDHVAVFVVRHFEYTGARPPNGEVVASGFYAPDALPEGVTTGTRRRIAEVLDGRAGAGDWI